MYRVFSSIVSRFTYFKSISDKPILGRWNLKHNCKTEEIVVFNANRDHCGDLLCGDPNEYKKLSPKPSSSKASKT